MGELLRQWPSAALTLFARFGIGGREKLGFRPGQSLREVLARHLFFDVETVLQRLEEVEIRQRAYRLSPSQFARQMPGLPLLDCRSPQEMALNGMPGARLLDREAVQSVKGQEVYLYDQDGTMTGAAADHLAGQGCRPWVLQGGLQAWSVEVDPNFPVQAAARASRVWILADWCQARFVCSPVTQSLEGDPSQVPFDCLRLWRHRDYLAVLVDQPPHWPEMARRVVDWMNGMETHSWRPQSRRDWQAELEQALAQDVQPNLQSHKGSIKLVEVHQGVARVLLGGGCQGCSSAAITVGQEVAAALFRAVPELEGVEDASEHEDPLAQPHH